MCLYAGVCLRKQMFRTHTWAHLNMADHLSTAQVIEICRWGTSDVALAPRRPTTGPLRVRCAVVPPFSSHVDEEDPNPEVGLLDADSPHEMNPDVAQDIARDNRLTWTQFDECCGALRVSRVVPNDEDAVPTVCANCVEYAATKHAEIRRELESKHEKKKIIDKEGEQGTTKRTRCK